MCYVGTVSSRRILQLKTAVCTFIGSRDSAQRFTANDAVKQTKLRLVPDAVCFRFRFGQVAWMPRACVQPWTHPFQHALSSWTQICQCTTSTLVFATRFKTAN